MRHFFDNKFSVYLFFKDLSSCIHSVSTSFSYLSKYPTTFPSIHLLSIHLLSIYLLSIHLLSIHLLSIHLLSIYLLSSCLLLTHSQLYLPSSSQTQQSAYPAYRPSSILSKPVSPEDILIAEGTATLELADQQVRTDNSFPLFIFLWLPLTSFNFNLVDILVPISQILCLD